GIRGLLPPATIKKQKRQTRRRNPNSFVAAYLTLLLFVCVPGTSSTRLIFPPVVLTGPIIHDIPFPLNLQLIPFMLPVSKVASFPLSHSWG
uniref:Uncharacterized protein n=1 Tax=Spermophilus dauricus TaxID=99837 RepID=A0A8C9UVY5_SPEDA